MNWLLAPFEPGRQAKVASGFSMGLDASDEKRLLAHEVHIEQPVASRWQIDSPAHVSIGYFQTHDLHAGCKGRRRLVVSLSRRDAA